MPGRRPGPHLEVRAFAAPIGIAEDPVTGSLNASLAQWLIDERRMPARYLAAQGARLERAGRIHIVRDEGGQVWVGGNSVTCISGEGDAVTPISSVDHLVVAADSLEQGAQWCEATLGIRPREGGEHPLMGTHNRVLRLATDRYPRAYIEIIAINRGGPAAGARTMVRPGRPCPATRRAAAAAAGALRCAIGRRRRPHRRRWAGSASSAAPLVQAQRQTPQGLLRWQISVRADGQRLFYGGLPTLIQWGDMHPADAMPESGLALQSLQVRHPRLAELQAAHEAIGLQNVTLEPGPPNLVATLTTPKGLVRLESAGH